MVLFAPLSRQTGVIMSRVPIADHALLSDCHTAALVTRDGSVDWLCLPRFDAPAQFARILDEDAGHWSIRPSGEARVSRRYLPDTLVLETTFEQPEATVTLTDTLATGTHGGHHIGSTSPHLLVRRLDCTGGEAEVEIVFRPRPEYGLVRPLLSAVKGGVAARGGADQLVLTCPLPLRIADATAAGRIHMKSGQTLLLALHHAELGETPARVWKRKELLHQLKSTAAAWRAWSKLHQTYEGPWQEAVRHSGRVLQGLTYQPSGAIVAAVTTSLPEAIGGERNWDYRFTWVRDACLTMEALWVAACPYEAADFFAFLATAAAESADTRLSLQIMFGIGGQHDLTERTLAHLSGWRASSPVRIGNDAWSQRQIDVYGELLSAAHRLAHYLTGMHDDTRAFLVACADAAAHRWREPDQGIWEVRGEPRHFLHSKVMCWAALNRAIDLADLLNAGDRVPEWRRNRDEIHQTVLDQGWNDKVGAFTQHFGSTALDAANLTMAITGFLPADDPRMLATIDATQQRLTDANGLVYRYRTERTEDGLSGREGTFLLCTFWLADALARSGQTARARTVFEHAAAHLNDVGLLAEEIDPATGEQLGNFPQAFSHIGLINAAWAIHQAERDAGLRPV